MHTDRLIKLRKDRSITQAELAKHLGIERTTYGKYETSGIQPPVEVIVKLAEFYDVTTDYLLGRDVGPCGAVATGNAIVGVNGHNTGTVTVTNGESHSRQLSKEELEILRIYSTLDAKSRHKMFDGILAIEEEYLGGTKGEA